MKSIFLVNAISGRGHLDSYARLYSRAFLELGYRVVLLAEADGGSTDYLMRSSPDLASNFSFISSDQARSSDHASTSCADQARARMNLAQRSLRVWQQEGARGVAVRCGRVPYRALSPLVPIPSLRYQINRIGRAIARRLLRTELARMLKLQFSLDVGRLMFQPLLDHVNSAISISEHPAPDLIFFLYLDLMAERRRNTAVLDHPGARPWIGILFHPRLARDRKAPIEGYFESKNARGGVFLLPSALSPYATAVPNLHFALAPDVADLELPAEPSKLAIDMRKQAGERTIVLQIGSIMAHKGIPTLLDVIGAADPSRFFFALIGEVFWETFAEQKDRVRSFYMQPPENVYLSQGYLKNEPDYNGLIAACDIVYAVYQDFGSSSNSLTKAAGFRRPILVSENSLMGERVRRSNIGAVAPAGNVEAILEKLVLLSKQPKDSFGF